MSRRSIAVGWLVAIGVLHATAAPGVAQSTTPNLCARAPEIRRVDFTGNREFSPFGDAQLLALVQSRPSSLTRRLTRVLGSDHRLNCRILAADSARLTGLYDVSGYSGTIVSPRLRAVGSDRVDITFEIRESPPIIIDSVDVHWLTPPVGVDTAALRARLYSQPGRSFDRIRLVADRDTIERVLKDHGYPDAAAQRNYALHTGRRATVALQVVPGPFVRFGEIRIEGRAAVEGKAPRIRNEEIRPLVGIDAGDPYSLRDLIAAQRRIYELGAHIVVRIEEEPRQPGDSVLNVTLMLQEDRVRRLDTEFGWATLDCFRAGAGYVDRAFMQTTRRLEVGAHASKLGWGRPTETTFTRQNLCGLRFGNSSLANDSLGSSKVNYNTTVTVSQPGSFGGRVIPSGSIYSERRSAHQAFLRETLLGLALSAAHTRSRVSTVGSYNLEYGHTDAEPAVLCFVFQACDEDARDQLTGSNRRLAVLGARMTRERLDDPVKRTSGTLISADVRVSNPVFGSDSRLSFNKATTDASWYRPFLNSGRNVLHLRLRGGIIAGGTRTGGGRLPPPQERLYGGGSQSHRGFQQNELGNVIYSIDQIAVDTGETSIDTTAASRPQRVIPIGGNSMFVGNLEYRVRDRFFPERLEHVFFLDVGRVWTRGAEGQIGYRWTPGLGLRLFTALGPLQFNLGYNGYDRPAGPAFYNQGIGGSGRAPLICVSPKDPSSASTCPATYVPSQSRSFWSRVAFTFAIGVE